MVAGLALGSALLHATWNALVKASGDRLVMMALVISVGGTVGGLATVFTGPPHPDQWLWLLGSVTTHSIYFFTLIQAYHAGDMSKVYPLSRGIAPLLVVLFGWLVFGTVPTGRTLAGVALVSVGILAFALERGAPRQGAAVFWALVTGLGIGAYSLNDAHGVRAGGPDFRAAYIAWMFFLDALPLGLVVIWVRRGRLLRLPGTMVRAGLGGGVISTISFAVIVWAFSLGAPAGIVALRETSVVFGAVIGAVFLGEGFGTRRVLAACVVALGVLAIAVP